MPLSDAHIKALEEALSEAICDLSNQTKEVSDPVRQLGETLLRQNSVAAALSGSVPIATLPSRPAAAVGTFLRIITVNDSYILDNYPRVASAVQEARASASELDAVVTSVMNGDFVSPSQLTALDGGRAMVQGLNHAQIEFLCLGNHEFDLPHKLLKKALGHFHGTCLNSNAEAEALAHLPKFARLPVGSHTAVLAGLCIADPSIYLPGHGFDSKPLDQAAIAVWDQAKLTADRTKSIFVPLTHQTVAADKALAEALGTHAELRGRVPAVLGGHEHEMFIDSLGPTTIVKVGQDCQRIGVVDVYWEADGTVRSAVHVLPAANFAPDPSAAAFVAKQDALMRDTLDIAITTLPEPLSSNDVRFKAGGMSTFLMSLVKRALRSAGVQIAIVQAGDVRGRADYPAGPFTLRQLFAELAFENPMAVCQLPGRVIAETVKQTYSSPLPSPRLLHFDAGVVLNAEHEVLEADGAPPACKCSPRRPPPLACRCSRPTAHPSIQSACTPLLSRSTPSPAWTP